MKKVRYFYLAGKETGYVIVPFGRRGAARILKPKRQGGAPDPGRRSRSRSPIRAKFKRLDFAARIAPSGSPEAADQIAQTAERRAKQAEVSRSRSGVASATGVRVRAAAGRPAGASQKSGGGGMVRPQCSSCVGSRKRSGSSRSRQYLLRLSSPHP
jgi:hypothetical protein